MKVNNERIAEFEAEIKKLTRLSKRTKKEEVLLKKLRNNKNSAL